ncbi:hypothetical protein LY90DRAFT_38453 [Neocallimastix californiae]|uniref:Uncharacterized protein n=1 Tax=Neocallimastix californiae TaxID=1754190 RepID=A0A1Y2F871_9FUNG|nr:hypothetical protein LY90DRAFT_38453 [Neocallimastix californiae]|eukprot:ORY80059.1 hypothetical protein LY90DRAFT_38453 [Neocallimastix californiae]
MNFKFRFNKNSKFLSSPNMRKTKKEKEEISNNNNIDRSYYNFQVLKKINRNYVNDIHIPKYLYTNTCNTDNNSDISDQLYDQYENERAKELKNIILKMSNIITEECKNNEDDEEDEDSKYCKNSNDDISYYNSYMEMRKPNKSNSYQYEKKEKVLKQFNKDLLNLSSLLEKKKSQLKNRENRIKQQELKIKDVLVEFDRIVNDDKIWKKDLEDIRNDFQSSIDVLNRENKNY